MAKEQIRMLSRVWPTHAEKSAVLAAIDPSSHPIITAILGASFVEHDLEILLRRHFRRNDDATWLTLLGDGGPLATFNAKILLGYAFRIYGEEIRDNLKIIANIRNVFAHSKKLVDFSNPAIVKELSRTKIVKGSRKHCISIRKPTSHPQGAFALLCLVIANGLSQIHVRRMSAKTRRIRKANINLLARALGADGPTKPRSRPPTPFPHSQSAGPMNLGYAGILAGLMNLPPDDGKKDK